MAIFSFRHKHPNSIKVCSIYIHGVVLYTRVCRKALSLKSLYLKPKQCLWGIVNEQSLIQLINKDEILRGTSVGTNFVFKWNMTLVIFNWLHKIRFSKHLVWFSTQVNLLMWAFLGPTQAKILTKFVVAYLFNRNRIKSSIFGDFRMTKEWWVREREREVMQIRIIVKSRLLMPKMSFSISKESNYVCFKFFFRNKVHWRTYFNDQFSKIIYLNWLYGLHSKLWMCDACERGCGYECLSTGLRLNEFYWNTFITN